MKVEFTINAPIPLTFIAVVSGETDAWRLLDYLKAGAFCFPITHMVIDESRSEV